VGEGLHDLAFGQNLTQVFDSARQRRPCRSLLIMIAGAALSSDAMRVPCVSSLYLQPTGWMFKTRPSLRYVRNPLGIDRRLAGEDQPPCVRSPRLIFLPGFSDRRSKQSAMLAQESGLWSFRPAFSGCKAAKKGLDCGYATESYRQK